jgi:hypothetical protein
VCADKLHSLKAEPQRIHRRESRVDATVFVLPQEFPLNRPGAQANGHTVSNSASYFRNCYGSQTASQRSTYTKMVQAPSIVGLSQTPL